MDKSSESQGGLSLRWRLITAGVWAGLGKALSAFGGFLVFLIVSKTLGQKDMSSLLLCESAAVIGTIFVTAGLHTVIVRVLRSWKNGSYRDGLFAFGLRILGIYLATFSIFALVVGTIFLSPETGWILPVSQYPGTVLSWVFLLGANQIVSEFLRGFENFRDAATMGGQNPGALTLAILLCLLIACRMAGVVGLSLVFGIQILAMTATLIWGLIRLSQTAAAQRITPTGTLSRLSYRIGFRDIISEGMPNLVSLVSTLGVSHLEILMIGQMCSDPNVAVYAGMKRLVQLTSAPLLMVNSALPTFIVDLVTQGKLARLEEILRGSATVCLLPLLFISSVFLFAPVTTVSLIFPHEYTSGAATLQLLSLGNIASVATGSCGLLLVMAGRPRYAMLSGLLAAVLFLVAAVPLTAAYGITGMSAGVAVVTAFRNVICMLLAKRTIGIWTAASLSPRTFWNFLKPFH
jgi:O-antigen/teichoic acid export membrane protein